MVLRAWFSLCDKMCSFVLFLFIHLFGRSVGRSFVWIYFRWPCAHFWLLIFARITAACVITMNCQNVSQAINLLAQVCFTKFFNFFFLAFGVWVSSVWGWERECGWWFSFPAWFLIFFLYHCVLFIRRSHSFPSVAFRWFLSIPSAVFFCLSFHFWSRSSFPVLPQRIIFRTSTCV